MILRYIKLFVLTHQNSSLPHLSEGIFLAGGDEHGSWVTDFNRIFFNELYDVQSVQVSKRWKKKYGSEAVVRQKTGTGLVLLKNLIETKNSRFLHASKKCFYFL